MADVFCEQIDCKFNEDFTCIAISIYLIATGECLDYEQDKL
jgi:hypothetical protein